MAACGECHLEKINMSGTYKEKFGFQRSLFRIKEIFKRNFNLQFLLYRVKWNYFPKIGFLSKFPLHVDIETTDKCNLKCVMCVHGQGKDAAGGFIDKDFAKKIIREAAEGGVYSIKLNWRGEPALHKDLSELVRFAKECGIMEVQINTNGLPFSEQKIKDIIEAGLDRVIFSVDANSGKTYSRIRIGGNFEVLIKNIESFIRIRKVLHIKKPFIRLQMVRMKENQDEVDGFIQRWKSRVDDLRVSDVTDRGQGQELIVGDQIAVGRIKCPQPWQRLVISRDGVVSGCCSDWYQNLVVGDMKKNSLKNIWRGEKMNMLRRRILDKRMDECEPCKSCYVKESYIWVSKD